MELYQQEYTFTIHGVARISWGKAVRDMKQGEEGPVYEESVWRDRFHRDEDGNLVIPAMAIKRSIEAAASHLGTKVKGKGNKTYARYMERGFLCMDDLALGKTVDDLKPEPLFVPSDGKRGGGKRVHKTFPYLSNWTASGRLLVFEPVLTERVMRDHLEACGVFIGLGRFRPQNCGTYGRFALDSFEAA